MKKFIVEPTFWEIFPEGQVRVLTVKAIHNEKRAGEETYFAQLLDAAAQEAKNYLTEEPFSQNPVIVEWRDAFSRFKTKKGVRSSIEALLKRAYQEREFMPINPLVDFYNSVSLKYAVPCGGEDLHSVQGDLRLGKAKGGEPFLPLGADEDAPALPEEIIYCDDAGAVCRCLNWREAQRTMLTERTTEAVLVIEAINQKQAERAEQAVRELKQQVDAYFQTNSVVTVLTSEQPEALL